MAICLHRRLIIKPRWIFPNCFIDPRCSFYWPNPKFYLLPVSYTSLSNTDTPSPVLYNPFTSTIMAIDINPMLANGILSAAGQIQIKVLPTLSSFFISFDDFCVKNSTSEPWRWWTTSRPGYNVEFVIQKTCNLKRKVKTKCILHCKTLNEKVYHGNVGGILIWTDMRPH